MSNIEWTEKTWNPIVGCTVVSPGCTNCYAMKMAARIERMGGAPQYDGATQKTKGGAVWTGKMTLAEKALLEPLKRKKPTMYFVNSMGDLFHENVPDEWIDQVFSIMGQCPQHTFQILTKRSSRMREYVVGCQNGADDIGGVWPLPNVWLGVSAEDQTRWDERWPDLARTPAAVRFVSAEPLLGPIDMIGAGKLDWVIVGGESGPGARATHPEWARSIRDQCAAAGVSFFFKQWGEWKPISQMDESEYTPLYRPNRIAKEYEDQDVINDICGETCTKEILCLQLDGHHRNVMDVGAWGHGAMQAFKIGKKAAGRTLDGVTHDGMPTVKGGEA